MFQYESTFNTRYRSSQQFEWTYLDLQMAESLQTRGQKTKYKESMRKDEKTTTVKKKTKKKKKKTIIII